jgi:hypothetical protein
MNNDMRMYENTRYTNQTSKKRVVNLIVPTHLTEYTIKLPETLRLDKVTDVYLDQVTDMAGETTELFVKPSETADGAKISVRRNARNFGMDGNKDDNAQLMVIKIDELEMQNISAMGDVMEKEDYEAINYYNNFGLDDRGYRADDTAAAAAARAARVRPSTHITHPGDLPKFWHRRVDNTWGVYDVIPKFETVGEEEAAGQNFKLGGNPADITIGYTITEVARRTLNHIRCQNSPIVIDNSSGVAAESLRFDDSDSVSINSFKAVLRTKYESIAEPWEIYRAAFIYTTNSGSAARRGPQTDGALVELRGTPLNTDLNNNGASFPEGYVGVTHSTSETGNGPAGVLTGVVYTDPVGNIGPFTLYSWMNFTNLDTIPGKSTTFETTNNSAIAKARQVLYENVRNLIYDYKNVYNRYKRYIKARREWHERVQRYEFTQAASSTLNKSIIVPNSKNVSVSDEYIHNFPITGIQGLTEDRLTPFQLATYDKSQYSMTDALKTNLPFVFPQTEHTIERDQGSRSTVLNENHSLLTNPLHQVYDQSVAGGGTFVKGYDKRGVHTHRLNKFNFISTLQPKNIESFKLSYGFFKSRVLGISREDRIRQVNPYWDLSQGRPMGHQERTHAVVAVNLEDKTDAAFTSNIQQRVPEEEPYWGTQGETFGIVDDPPEEDWIGWTDGIDGEGAALETFHNESVDGTPTENFGGGTDVNAIDRLEAEQDWNDPGSAVLLDTGGTHTRIFNPRAKPVETYNLEKYPGADNYRGGTIRPLSYDNNGNKYDNGIDSRSPNELAVANNPGPDLVTDNFPRVTDPHTNPDARNPPRFGIAEPDMRYSPDVGRLCITLVFIERDN